MKKITRKPIILNRNAVALINIFTRDDKVEDILFSYETQFDNPYEQLEQSAKQFISQLEEQECDAFLLALGKEALKQYLKNRERVLEEDTVSKIKEELKSILKK